MGVDTVHPERKVSVGTCPVRKAGYQFSPFLVVSGAKLVHKKRVVDAHVREPLSHPVFSPFLVDEKTGIPQGGYHVLLELSRSRLVLAQWA